ncbi:MAG: hypothetical protein R3B97_09045 [Dehalococcoidia bacterium]
MRNIRVGLAQFNPTVGDLEGTLPLSPAELLLPVMSAAPSSLFPELAVTGYPPEDLVLRRAFCDRSREITDTLAPLTAGIIAVVGFVDWVEGSAFNAAAVLCDGRWVVYHKQRLPNYGVFDEERYFATGPPRPCIP